MIAWAGVQAADLEREKKKPFRYQTLLTYIRETNTLTHLNYMISQEKRQVYPKASGRVNIPYVLYSFIQYMLIMLTTLSYP